MPSGPRLDLCRVAASLLTLVVSHLACSTCVCTVHRGCKESRLYKIKRCEISGNDKITDGAQTLCRYRENCAVAICRSDVRLIRRRRGFGASIPSELRVCGSVVTLLPRWGTGTQNGPSLAQNGRNCFFFLFVLYKKGKVCTCFIYHLLCLICMQLDLRK